ncbi:hypothetical protein VNO77_19459 [Canavalia gladiata]|uniref:Uncharacterized protein n=1 Tax=Canavalia gladiata TaxID=3824 RepID=A0AAN9LRK6_CANGL
MADVNRSGSCINMSQTEGILLVLLGSRSTRSSHLAKARPESLVVGMLSITLGDCPAQQVADRGHVFVMGRLGLTSAPPTNDLRRGLKRLFPCSTYFGCSLCNLDGEKDRRRPREYVDALTCRGLPPLVFLMSMSERVLHAGHLSIESRFPASYRGRPHTLYFSQGSYALCFARFY